MLLSVLAGNALARHFNPLDSQTGNYLSVYLDTAAHPTLDGTPIVANDEVGVFDSAGNCWGAGSWPTGATATFPVAGYNVLAGVEKPGMKPGNVMYFRVWDTALGEMSASVTFFPAGTPVPFNANITPYTDSAYENGNSTLNPSVPSKITGLGIPIAPVLALPTNGASGLGAALTLSWNSAAGAVSYAIQVSTASSFGTTVFSRTGLTATSDVASGLAGSATYYWKVNASNSVGTSPWSIAWSFVTPLAAPVAPTLSTPTNGATGQATSLTVSWGTVTNATSYDLQVATSSTFASTLSDQPGLSAASASVIGLVNSSTYYWRANATDAGGTGVWSSVWKFTTIVAIPGTPMLSSPTNGVLNQATALTLVWGTVTSAASYSILVSTSSTFATTVQSHTGLTAASGSVGGLGNSTTYYWEASATNAGGTSAWSGIWSFTTIIAAPGAPVLSSPTSGSTNEATALTLAWGTVANAASYGVQVSTVSTFASTVSSQAGLAAISAAVSDLSNSTTYYWRVNATDVGGTGVWSGVWNFATIVAIPGAPTLASPTNGAGNQATSLTMSWSAVTGAASYNVLVSTVSTFASTVSSQTGLASALASVGGLGNSATYYWKASATNAAGTGVWSAVWDFTTIMAAPGALVLSSPTSGSTNEATALTLAWGTVANAASYGVQVSASSTFGTTVAAQSGLTTGSATVGGLSGSTVYYWRANATDAGGTGVWSGIWSFTTVVEAPVAPTLSTPTNGATGQATSLTVSWGTVSSATSYAVQVSTVSTFASTVSSRTGVTAASAAVGGLVTGIGYYWEVNATGAGGTSAWSGVWSFSTGKNLVIPIAIGWNMNSLNLHPADSTTVGIFGAFKGSILVKDASGNEYFPAFGLDGITTLTTGRGYQIYDDSIDTIRVTGSQVNLDSTSIALPDSIWSIIAYLPQATMNIDTALAGIASQIILVKDNAGGMFFPGFGLNTIDTMCVGQGYQIVTSAPATLTYPVAGSAAKQRAATGGGKPLRSLPAPRHYAKHRITGGNASFVAQNIEFAGNAAADKSEVGAFDTKGNLVGAGTVIDGFTAFAVWGDDHMATVKDGCELSERITFRLWTGQAEYPLQVTGGNAPAYAANKIIVATLAVPAQAVQSSFDLPRASPNPFRGGVRIAFDVPALRGTADQDVDIGIYDMKGCLVRKIAGGRYAAGSYTVFWNGTSPADRTEGAKIYFVRMKVNGFEKEVKLIELK
jgi:hypothetical protein